MSKNISSDYEKRISNQIYGLCSDCNRSKTFWGWCKNCNSKLFQKSFNCWTSGNEIIDQTIQDTQLNARNKREVIEWIPFDRFRNIQYLAQDGRIRSYCDDEKKQLDRKVYKLNEEDYKIAKNKDTRSPLQENEKTGFPIVLKKLNNSSNIHDGLLNEWNNFLKIIHSSMDNYSDSIRLYGITQDPVTLDYMIVMEYMSYGSLRSNLMVKKYNPIDKFINLLLIARSLSTLHKCNLIHGDFHSGNLLLQSQKYAYISDFGLCRPADNSNNSNEIYGVLPYIAPEVLRGNPYTKSADIYSFGIVMWEMTSGVPAFYNLPHDLILSLEICHGLRPKIVKGTEFDYVELMEKCWDPDPNKRPTADDLIESFKVMRSKYHSNYDRVQVPENESIIEFHPLSCYTSRKFDFSTILNEILIHSNLISSESLGSVLS
ncbi:kinase-like domain-containing protein [Glomus cerebriforme]|uniref:Kinase-like domain-containing protein n=1 Tax=Glomus cerebriforme TaxID=658196 RepID=A0A397T181_9GLOM|nr:kinase-like domain-containing protein [Glomus cerebriforme]